MERVFVTRDREALHLALSWPDGGETLYVTAEHPMWVEGEGWVQAGYLRNGDKVARADAGGWATVQSLRGPPGKETVYNFVVANTHTYFVGTGGTWVHNGGPCQEKIVLLHGTDEKSVSDIVQNGLNRSKARKQGGGDVFWMVEEAQHDAAKWFAESSPGVTNSGRDPAVLGMEIPKSVLDDLVSRGYVALDVKRFGYPVYGIKSEHWKQINEIVKFFVKK